ncbi:MAG: glucose-6-phosphate isomerase, partial [Bacteroidia bacterium]|nr:glucose-6-phosphate isomerase [Bacteroidia bacterium]NND10422.1 glucose-6-phosphate isomerase [Flavobacteriaceae bacterium]
MPLPKTNPTKTRSWENLENHFSEIKDLQIKDWFKRNSERANSLSIIWDDFLLDFSKNRIDDKGFRLLLDLAEEVKLKESISKYFEGDNINETEKRAVLHTA